MEPHTTENTSSQSYTLATVSRVLDVLESLAQNDRGIGLRALSESVRLPKATAFRYLVTLEERGYVRKDPDNGEYRLGLKILDLGSRVLNQIPIHEIALPHLRDLLTRFQETVNLGVLEHNEVVYLEVIDSPQTFKMSAHVGARDYPHATSLGKAMLAFLPEKEVERIVRATGMPKRTEKTICSLPRLKEELTLIRRRGYCIDDQENEQGACCVGAPLLDYQGNVMAAISLSGPAPRFSQEVIENIGAALIEITSQISRKMQYLKRP